MDGSTLASRSASVPEVAQRPARRFSPWLDAWRRFRRHRLAFASGIVLLAMILAIAFGPFVWKVAINDIDFAARMQTPSWKHPFGTDDLGQDLLARMLYGGRISLAVGLSAMFVAITVGTIIGAIAGMSRSWVSPALMWVTDLFLSLPALPLPVMSALPLPLPVPVSLPLPSDTVEVKLSWTMSPPASAWAEANNV